MNASHAETKFGMLILTNSNASFIASIYSKKIFKHQNLQNTIIKIDNFKTTLKENQRIVIHSLFLDENQDENT